MTKAEKAWFAAITDLGCIVNRLYGVLCLGDLQRHHVTSGGRRIGHEASICLCWGSHQSGKNDAAMVSRHPWSREFHSRYGTDQFLLKKTRELVGVAA
jgi:hypothetical protein